MGSSELEYDLDISGININSYMIANKCEVEDEKALLVAAAEGDYNTLEQLLISGVCVDVKAYSNLLFSLRKNYFTPLHLATKGGHVNCAKLLINYGADVNSKDFFGQTPLHLAAYNGRFVILKLLLDSGADCSPSTTFCPSTHPIMVNRMCYLDFMKSSSETKRIKGSTPLHLAAETNNLKCVQELIRYGADFNAVDDHGRTSLYIATQFAYSECVLIHLKEAVGREILSLPSKSTFDTPLHFAVRFCMIDCVKELLRLGSDVNHLNFEGLSPLHLAIISANTKIDVMEILKLLVLEGHKTDVNLLDHENFTPLHYVCFRGRKQHKRSEIAKFLIAYGANVNIEDNLKCSLLEGELRSPQEDFEILKCAVKGLLYLPRLKCLNITPSTKPFANNQFQPVNLHDPNNDLLLQQSSMLLEYNRPMLIHADAANSIYEIELAEVEELHDSIPDPFAIDDIEEIEEIEENILTQFPVLEKHIWYEKLASNPRSLQHHCRFLIRSILGPMKIKYINKLPVPPKLQSYLLLNSKD